MTLRRRLASTALTFIMSGPLATSCVSEPTSEAGTTAEVAPHASFIEKPNEGPNTAPTNSQIEQAVIDAPQEVISLEAKKFDCSKLAVNSCDSDEPSNGFRCALVQNNNLLIAEDQQLMARGESRCFAKTALEIKLCDAKILMNGGIIECHPDTAPVSECELEPTSCDDAPQIATRCFAKELEDDDLSWTHRPEAWGKSECEAKKQLNKMACKKGIAPSALKAVTCEKEASPEVCPPIQQNCLVTTGELVECRIQKVGEVKLKEPLKGYGSNTCEASYRAKDLACRWQRKTITDLNDIECRSISRGEGFTPAASIQEKIYKKVRKL